MRLPLVVSDTFSCLRITRMRLMSMPPVILGERLRSLACTFIIFRSVRSTIILYREAVVSQIRNAVTILYQFPHAIRHRTVLYSSKCTMRRHLCSMTTDLG